MLVSFKHVSFIFLVVIFVCLVTLPSIYLHTPNLEKITPYPQSSLERPQHQPPRHRGSSSDRRTNVVLIVVDDLRPELSAAYGRRSMYTPFMDELSREALTFDFAFAQYPHCAPSRNSFLSGRAPDTSRVYNFVDGFRTTDIGENWVTLPGFFKKNGFYTLGGGKLFNSKPFNRPVNDDLPRSFDKYFYPNINPNTDTLASQKWFVICFRSDVVASVYLQVAKQSDCYLFHLQRRMRLHARGKQPIPFAPGLSFNSSVLRMQCLDTDVDHGVYFDTVLARAVAAEVPKALAILKQGSRVGQPLHLGGQEALSRPGFFLGVGFHRPHTPWVVPRSFFAAYRDGGKIVNEFGDEHGYVPPTSLPRYGEPPKIGEVPSEVPISCWNRGINPWRSTEALGTDERLVMRAAYHASVTLVDEAVGRVLHALREHGVYNDTVVALVSDHGFLLGEHGQWCKRQLYDISLRVPFLLRVPWAKHTHGRHVPHPVDLLDLYRTLAGIVGLQDKVQSTVEGVDVSPVLFIKTRRNGAAGGLGFDSKNSPGITQAQQQPGDRNVLGSSILPGLRRYSFSQVARCGVGRSGYHSPPGCSMRSIAEITSMGYSVRDSEWRYTLWLPFTKTGIPAWDQGRDALLRTPSKKHEELYDHQHNIYGAAFENFESLNIVEDPQKRETRDRLLRALLDHFGRHGGASERVFDYRRNFRWHKGMGGAEHRCLDFDFAACARHHAKNMASGGSQACFWDETSKNCLPLYMSPTPD